MPPAQNTCILTVKHFKSKLESIRSGSHFSADLVNDLADYGWIGWPHTPLVHLAWHRATCGLRQCKCNYVETWHSRISHSKTTISDSSEIQEYEPIKGRAQTQKLIKRTTNTKSGTHSYFSLFLPSTSKRKHGTKYIKQLPRLNCWVGTIWLSSIRSGPPGLCSPAHERAREQCFLPWERSSRWCQRLMWPPALTSALV